MGKYQGGEGHIKKGPSYIQPAKDVIYKLIISVQIGNNISKISKVLGITRSSYYRWKACPVGIRKIEDTIIGKKVKTIFISHKQRYGSKRIAAELKD